MDDNNMRIQATVDLPSAKKVNAQIRALEKSISKLKISGQFDEKALKNLTKQLTALKTTVSTAGFSPTALKNLTDQVEKALSSINISTSFDKELTVFEKILSETKVKLLDFFEVFERGGIKSQAGSIDAISSQNKQTPLNSELLDNYERFKNEFNNTFLNADALSKQLGEIAQRIIDYTITCKNSESATKDFNASLNNTSFLASTGKIIFQSLTSAGNKLLNLALNLLSNWVIKKIYNLIYSVERCKESVDGLVSSYKSALDESNRNAETIKKLASRYEELSKGVNNLGCNVSLTSDEYSEYNDIVNQIANMFPSLVQGYTDEGTAILSLKDNVGELTHAYKDAQREAYNLLIVGDNADDIIKNWENLHNSSILSNTFINGFTNLGSVENGAYSVEEALSFLKEFNELNYEDFKSNGFTLNSYLRNALSIDTYDYASISETEYQAMRNRATSLIQIYQAEIDSALENVRMQANAFLKTNDFYLDDSTSDELKNALSIMVNSIDEEIANSFYGEVKNISKYVNTIVNKIKNNDEAQDALINLFNLDISDMAPEDAKAQVDEYIKYIAELIGEDQLDLKIRLGFDNIDETATNYRNLLHDTAKKVSGASDGEIINQRGNYEKYQEIYDAIDEFANEYSINTQDELAYLQDALEKADYDIDKAFKLYLQKMESLTEGDTFTPTISSSVEQISRQLEPQFAKLGEVYSSIFNEDGTKIDLEVIDNNMLESLRKSFSDIEEEIGVVFDDSQLNRFFDILTDGTSEIKNVQDAFNDLATAYFYSTDTLEHLNEKTAESIKQQLQQMGVINSEEVINHYLSLAEAESGLIEIQNQLADAQEALAESSNTGEYESAKGRIGLIYKQIEAFYNEKGATEELRIALFNLQLQQANLSINSINSSSSIDELMRLANAAGLSGEYMERLVRLQDLMNQYHSTSNGHMQSAIQHEINVTKQELENLGTAPLELKFNFPSGKNSGADAAGKDAAQEYLEGFNNECDRLKFLRDNSIITEKEYLDQLRILYEQYFKDKEEYLEEYVKYEHEYLNGLKSLYENVLGGITDLLDKQMDKLGEERDAKIDALEAEQEARTKALEQQKEQLDLQIEEIESQIKIKDAAIDAINDEIDAIKKANDERQRQLDLQKALYDLERMQNQRTILQYSEDKGMHYVNDTSGIRDAKQAVDDAKTEIEIADKEKQISLIEDEISLLETRKTLIEDQQADLDNQINALDEFYQKLTENTESYYLALIAPIEQYKAQFESIAEIESGAVFDEQLNSLGYSANDILALSSSTLENFKSNYLGILGDIYAGNTQMLDSLSMVSGLNGENLIGYLSQSQPYIDSLARLDLSSTQSAIDSANNGIYSFADGAVLATTNITTMADTTTALLEGDKKHAGIISSFETMASVLTDANNQIAGITSGMEELDGKTATIKINIETNGDTSLLGKAYSSGTAIAGSSHLKGSAFVSGNWAVQSNEQNSLVGEEGFEIIVRNGKFFTVGNNGAELANIQKGDIVFNHEQSKNLLKYGHISGRGKAYADGSVGSGKILTSGGLVLRPLQPGAQMYDLVQKFDAYIKSIDGNLKQLVPGSFYEHNRQMNEMVNHMTNSSVVNNRNIQPVINNEIRVTLPNVTNSTSAETLMKDLQSLGTKKFQVNW